MGSFRNQLKSGFFYTAASKYAGIVISLIVTAVLSRLLPPEDFGVIAVASVFIVFFSILSDMGISSAIIQKRNLSPTDLKNIYSFSVYLGVLLGFIFFISSWAISIFYSDNQLILICQLLSINVLFATLNIVPNGCLLRDQEFKFLGLRSIFVQIIFGIISIICAYSGLGVYSLLINPIGSSILVFILSYIKYPIGFTFLPSFNSIRKIASYSSYTFGFSIINYFTRNLDKLLIGKYLGLSSLGFYEKSYRLMLLPVQNLTQVITPVLHPVLSTLQDDTTSQIDKYFKLVEILAIIGFPISAFLYFSASDLILIIFGNQWIPSIPIFQILGLTVGLQITGSLSGSLYLAANKTKEMFYIGIANTVINITGLLIGLYVFKSIAGVAWMLACTFYIGLWNNWYIAKIFNIRIIDTFKPYVPMLIPTLATIIILSLIYISSIENHFVNLILNGIVTLSIILIALKFNNILDIYEHVRRKISHMKDLSS